MTNIYDQHETAFNNVSAYVVVAKGERVATIAFKFPRDGAGRLYVYVHWLGVEMVRGFAGGYGYDKRTAACAKAAGQMKMLARKDCTNPETPLRAFVEALKKDDGRDWNDALRIAGFEVWSAV